MMGYSATNETDRNAAETQSIASNSDGGMDDENLDDEDQKNDCLDPSIM